jgi:hypothetical protein
MKSTSYRKIALASDPATARALNQLADKIAKEGTPHDTV